MPPGTAARRTANPTSALAEPAWDSRDRIDRGLRIDPDRYRRAWPNAAFGAGSAAFPRSAARWAGSAARPRSRLADLAAAAPGRKPHSPFLRTESELAREFEAAPVSIAARPHSRPVAKAGAVVRPRAADPSPFARPRRGHIQTRRRSADRRTVRIAVHRPPGPIQDRLLHIVGRLANRMLPIPIVADRTVVDDRNVRMENQARGSVEGCHNRSALGLECCYPLPIILPRPTGCTTPSLAIVIRHAGATAL